MVITVTSGPHGGPTDAVEVAERVLAVLDGGRFTTTYKFAVMLALIDCCLEGVNSTGEPPTVVHAHDVARVVLVRYWNQAAPWPGDEHARVPLQSRQNDLVRRILEIRAQLGPVSLADARRTQRAMVEGLLRETFVTIVRMPLPKLQRVGELEQTFLFTIGWPDEVPRSRVLDESFDDRIHLLPGVGAHLIRLAGLLRPVIEERWAAFVAARNPELMEHHQLTRFLFGAERTSLARVTDPLRELQGDSCFYCHERLSTTVDVDHFLPWSRSRDDGLDNLVVAHRGCNGDKRDSLAALEHLGAWRDRSQRSELDAVASASRWSRDARRTSSLGMALYRWSPPATPLWVARGAYEPLNHARLLSVLSPRLAAEDRSGYETER